jgi:hypothetical protein
MLGVPGVAGGVATVPVDTSVVVSGLGFLEQLIALNSIAAGRMTNAGLAPRLFVNLMASSIVNGTRTRRRPA